MWRLVICFFFFFSSRRRHTRWPRDWSSDVCSSDLRRDGALLLGHLRLWEHGRVPGRGGARARRGLGGDDRLPRARATLAAPRPGDADLPALARRRSVRGGVLGEALRLLGRGVGGTLLARAGRGGPHGRRALLLPGRRQAHVHRAARAARARPPGRAARARRAPVRRGRRRPRGVPRPLGDGGAPRGRATLLTLRKQSGLLAK